MTALAERTPMEASMTAVLIDPTTQDAAPENAVTFVDALPGLPADAREFSLEPLDSAGHLFALRSATTSTRLFLLQPGPYFTDYTPVPSPEALASLGLDSDPDATAFLVVLNPGDDASAATANLVAPIILNTRTRRATQTVLDDAWPLRAPLAHP